MKFAMECFGGFMLKKRLKRFFTVVLAVMIVCVLTACSTKLDGTYTSKEGVVKQSFIFDGDTVKVSAFDIDINGTYEIKDDEITITYRILNLSYDFVKSFKKSGDSIFIDGVEFVKE